MKLSTIATIGAALLIAGAPLSAQSLHPVGKGEKNMLENGTMTLGVNYWESRSATQMWRKWSPETVEKDMKVLAEHGMNLFRVFPTWNDFQPIYEIHKAGRPSDIPYETRMFETEEFCPDTPAGYAGIDETMMERFEEFCNIAEKHGIKLIVCLLTGHMTARLFLPRALEGLNLYEDPIALKWEGRFIDYFVRRMKHHPAIIAWESGNETHCLGPVKNSAQAEFWLRYIHTAIRSADPSRPVIGVNGLNITAEENPWVSATTAKLSDYVSVHPYNMWSKAGIEEFNSLRNLTYCAAHNSGLEQVAGKPSFVEEHGLWRPMAVSLDRLAMYQRGLLWNLWASNGRGMLWWCAFDQEQLDISPYNWNWPGVEHGVFRSDRTPQPGAKKIAAFGKFLKSLDFSALPKAKADAVFLACNRDLVHSSYVFARQAGIIPEYQSPEEPIRDAKFYFIPSAKARAMLTTRRWEELLAKVRNGATLFLAWDDTYLARTNEVCGMEVLSRRVSSGSMTYRFNGFEVTMPRPVDVKFRALTAEVLATDSEGNPCFFRNRYGKGTVYTLGFPMERLAYDAPGHYDGEAWKIYETVLRKELLVKTDSRYVLESEHAFSENRVAVLLVNSGLESYTGKPVVAPGWKIVSAKTDDPAAVQFENGTLKMEMNSGILLILERMK